jgi:hypothetical protein
MEAAALAALSALLVRCMPLIDSRYSLGMSKQAAMGGYHFIGTLGFGEAFLCSI